ncbi:MAG: glycosyltransferase family 39 protein, partial [Candidatus Margulisiibacteriota bacterium]
ASIRYFTLFYSLLTTLALFALGYLLWGRVAALLSALLYALFSGGIYIYGSSANTETFMVLFMVLALYSFVRAGRQTHPWLLLTGLFSGLAFMTKQVALFNFAVFPIFLFFVSERFEVKLRKILWLMVGFAVFPIVFSVYFWTKGAFLDFLNSAFFANLGYLAGDVFYHDRFNFNKILFFAYQENSIIWLLGTVGAVYILIKDRVFGNLLLAFWGLASFMGILAGTYFWEHYFIAIIPALALLSAYTIQKWQELKPPLLARVFFVSSLLLLVLFALPYQLPVYLGLSPQEISVVKYGGNEFVVAQKVGEVIKKVLPPGEGIFIWGAEPEVYFYSRMRSVSRYTYFYPLKGKSPAAAGRIKELLSELKTDNPKLIVWVQLSGLDPEFREFLEKNYRLYFSVEDWRIFKRK